jgi:hypothetical protein
MVRGQQEGTFKGRSQFIYHNLKFFGSKRITVHCNQPSDSFYQKRVENNFLLQNIVKTDRAFFT